MKYLRRLKDGVTYPYNEAHAKLPTFEVVDTDVVAEVAPAPKKKATPKKSRKKTVEAPATTEAAELNSDLGSLDELSNN